MTGTASNDSFKTFLILLISNGAKRSSIVNHLENSGFDFGGVDRKKVAAAEKIYQKLKDSGIKILTYKDKEYPRRLKENLSDYPPILFVWGSTVGFEKSVGIVGTRRCDGYGKSVTEAITRKFVEAGHLIISGGAKGVDTYSHETALRSGGKTVAILGSGILNLYPRENRKLFFDIANSGGAVISMFAPEEKPARYNFPIRNRLIAAMSDFLIVTRAPSKSGAIITAEIAFKMGKRVYVVVGDIRDKFSEGTSFLLKKGAVPIVSLSQVSELAGSLTDEKSRKFPVSTHGRENSKLDTEEELVYEALSSGGLYFDELSRKLKFSPDRLLQVLTVLEIKGLIVKRFGNFYEII